MFRCNCDSAKVRTTTLAAGKNFEACAESAFHHSSSSAKGSSERMAQSSEFHQSARAKTDEPVHVACSFVEEEDPGWLGSYTARNALPRLPASVEGAWPRRSGLQLFACVDLKARRDCSLGQVREHKHCIAQMLYYAFLPKWRLPSRHIDFVVREGASFLSKEGGSHSQVVEDTIPG